jgi:ATP-dependent exoDNAse (exonuclease V) alpha subunit
MYYANLNEITLAFAIAIHKAKGSEYPVVILPMFMHHSRPQVSHRRWFPEGDWLNR